MEFWWGIALTLLLETVVLIFATEKLRKEIRNAKKDSVSG